MTAQQTVRAAGGVIRRRSDGGVQVLVAHRPRYDDWSFPKGKRDEGETDEECALREVLEETGFVCEIGPELSSTSYRDSRGRPKTVRYWLMQASSGSFEPNDEVDEVRWLGLEEARRILSYRHDLNLLEEVDGG